MMKTLFKLSLVAFLAVGLAAAAMADETKTVTGKVTCGKCALKKAEACQNVLVADGQGVLAREVRGLRQVRPRLQGREDGQGHRHRRREGREDVAHRHVHGGS